MTETDAIREFMTMYVGCSRSGLRTLSHWLDGERPGSPEEVERRIDSFLAGLSEEQQRILPEPGAAK